jgi:hypothetical protein
MSPEEIQKLKEMYTGRNIIVEAIHPELTRWTNVPGRVITFNCNGRAIVQFEGADEGFYDIEPEYLQLAEPSAEQT